MPVPDDYYVEPNQKKKYFPFPADKYTVMVYDVNPIKELSFKGDEMVDKLEFVFVVLDDKKFSSEDENGEPNEESTRGRRLWRKIPRSFSPGGKYKASLFFELMCAIERKTLDKDELSKVQPNTLIGQQLAVFVSVNESWNNIESFMKVDKELEVLPTVLDKDPEEGQKEKASTENPGSAEEFENSMKEGFKDEDFENEVPKEKVEEIFSKKE